MNQIKERILSTLEIVLICLGLSGVAIFLIGLGTTGSIITVLRSMLVFYGIIVIGYMTVIIVEQYDKRAELKFFRKTELQKERLKVIKEAEALDNKTIIGKVERETRNQLVDNDDDKYRND